MLLDEFPEPLPNRASSLRRLVGVRCQGTALLFLALGLSTRGATTPGVVRGSLLPGPARRRPADVHR
jgi:hypothetical protein